MARAVFVESLEARLQFSAFCSVASGGTPVPNDSSDTATPVNFGTAAVNSTGPSKTFTVTNLTGEDIDLAILVDGAPDFTFNADSLALSASGAGQSATFTATLKTSSPGVHIDLLKLEFASTGYNFPLQGTVLPADLGAIGASTVASNGAVIASDNQDTLGNPRATETNQFARFELQAPENLLTLNASTTLNAEDGDQGNPMDLLVQVLPAPNGATQPDGTQTPLFSQTIVTDAADGDAGSLSTPPLTLPSGAYFVQMSATGIDEDTFSGIDTESYQLSLAATPLNPAIAVSFNGQSISNGGSSSSLSNGTNFGSAVVGANTVVETYTVTNTGNGALTLGSPNLGGDAFDVEQNPPSALAPGQSGTFQIGLLTSAAGQKTDTVSLPTNVSGENPFTFAISGAVTAPAAASAEVFDAGQQIANGQSSAISFGALPVSATPPAQTFTVKNQGTASLAVGAITVPSGFTLVSGISSAIPPRGSVSFVVQMNTAAAGSPAGSVTFTTNDPNAPSFNFPISGTVSSGTSSQGLSVATVTTQKVGASVVSGQKTSTGLVLVTLKNISGAMLTGSAAVTIFASPSSGAVAGGSLTLGKGTAKVKLKSEQSQVVKIKVAFPSVSASGTFFIVAQAIGAGITSGATAVGTASNIVNLLAPFVSLQGPGAGGALSATPGKPFTFSILLQNQGNVAAIGSINFDPLLSTDGTVSTAAALPGVVEKISIKPNASKAFKLKVTLPSSTAAASYLLQVRLQSNGALAGLNLLDGQVVASFAVNAA